MRGFDARPATLCLPHSTPDPQPIVFFFSGRSA
jgi:hypothetical protein